jgi:hypothetical protein
MLSAGVQVHHKGILQALVVVRSQHVSFSVGLQLAGGSLVYIITAAAACNKTLYN